MKILLYLCYIKVFYKGFYCLVEIEKYLTKSMTKYFALLNSSF